MTKFDITDKLELAEDPVLVIKGKEIPVNTDAVVMLKLMDIMDGEEFTARKMREAYEIMFSVKARKTIDSLGLKVNDWQKVVESAIELISDGTLSGKEGETEPGEGQSHTTT